MFKDSFLIELLFFLFQQKQYPQQKNNNILSIKNNYLSFFIKNVFSYISKKTNITLPHPLQLHRYTPYVAVGVVWWSITIYSLSLFNKGHLEIIDTTTLFYLFLQVVLLFQQGHPLQVQLLLHPHRGVYLKIMNTTTF